VVTPTAQGLRLKRAQLQPNSSCAACALLAVSPHATKNMEMLPHTPAHQRVCERFLTRTTTHFHAHCKAYGTHAHSSMPGAHAASPTLHRWAAHAPEPRSWTAVAQLHLRCPAALRPPVHDLAREACASELTVNAQVQHHQYVAVAVRIHLARAHALGRAVFALHLRGRRGQCVRLA